jgi:hypothetical protein
MHAKRRLTVHRAIMAHTVTERAYSPAPSTEEGSMVGMRGVLFVACQSLMAACMTAPPPPAPHSVQSCDARLPQDSSIALLQVVPSDSVWLNRNGTTIILSMRDAEAYFGIGPLSYDNRALRDDLRRAFHRDGTAQLDESDLTDLLAAHLLLRGKAVVRSPRGEQFSCIWTRLEIVEVDGRVIAHRVFFGPTNLRFLRVLDSVTVS